MTETEKILRVLIDEIGNALLLGIINDGSERRVVAEINQAYLKAKTALNSAKDKSND